MPSGLRALRGFLARFHREHGTARRVRLEDALKHVHAAEERGAAATTASLAEALRLSLRQSVDLAAEMARAGLLEVTGAGLCLTTQGRLAARRVVRAHRLLERRLADELGMPLVAVHGAADRDEHWLSPAAATALESRLGYPARDPHGDPIPSASGALPRDETVPLTSCEIGQSGEIVHLEDEPHEILDQVLAAGLRPGMQIEVRETGPQGLTIWDGERAHVVPRSAAASIDIAPQAHPPRPALRLSALGTGETARVVGLDCQGFARRRLLDLGLTPGTLVERCFSGPFGDPTAYRVRGALIALRRAQADEIRVERSMGETGEPR